MEAFIMIVVRETQITIVSQDSSLSTRLSCATYFKTAIFNRSAHQILHRKNLIITVASSIMEVDRLE